MCLLGTYDASTVVRWWTGGGRARIRGLGGRGTGVGAGDGGKGGGGGGSGGGGRELFGAGVILYFYVLQRNNWVSEVSNRRIEVNSGILTMNPTLISLHREGVFRQPWSTLTSLNVRFRFISS